MTLRPPVPRPQGLAAALALAVALALTPPAGAQQQPEGLEPAPEPPPLPAPVQSGETLEPDVTIRRTDDATIHEYSINGRVYAVKVVPRVGPEYYLVDVDGDGQFDNRRDDLSPDFLVNHWRILSW